MLAQALTRAGAGLHDINGWWTGKEDETWQIVKYEQCMEKDKEAYLLAFVTMNGGGIELASQVASQLVAHPLCGAEDDEARAMGLGPQNLHDPGQLLVSSNALQTANLRRMVHSCRICRTTRELGTTKRVFQLNARLWCSFVVYHSSL